MSDPTIEFDETLDAAMREARRTGCTENLRMLASYIVDNDPEYAEAIIQRANEIEDEHDIHYDEWVDNNAPRD